jgi:hypothetical protein
MLFLLPQLIACLALSASVAFGLRMTRRDAKKCKECFGVIKILKLCKFSVAFGCMQMKKLLGTTSPTSVSPAAAVCPNAKLLPLWIACKAKQQQQQQSETS